MGNKRLSGAATSSTGYSSVSSMVSLDMSPLESVENCNNKRTMTEGQTATRKRSITLNPTYGPGEGDIGESLDFEIDGNADNTNVYKTPAFDAFGETKIMQLQSYNIEKRFLQVCRFLLYVMIICVVLGGGAYTKLSLLSLVSKYKQSTGTDRIRYAIYFLVLICLYPCLTMISSLFKVLFGRVRSLSKQFISILIAIEVFQTVGLLLFLYKVVPNLSGMAILYVMMCGLIIPSTMSLINVVIFSKGNCRTRMLRLLCYGLVFFIQLGSIVVIYFLDILMTYGSNALEIYWTCPLSIGMISTKWWDNFIDLSNLKNWKSLKFGNLKDDLRKPREKANIWTFFIRSCIVGIFVVLTFFHSNAFFDIENSAMSQNVSTTTVHSNSYPKVNSSTRNNCLSNETNPNNFNNQLLSICNISNQMESTEVTQILNNTSMIIALPNENSQPKNQSTIKQMFKDTQDFVFEHALLLKIIVLTFCVSYAAALACKLHMQRIGFALPSILISPLTFVYVFLKCGDQLPFEIITLETDDICPTWEVTSPYHITLAVMLWISLYLLTYYIWFPESERMAKQDRLFIPMLKDCIFVDINLLLRRRKDTDLNHKAKENSGVHVVPKVYICATMWHENWKEMVQLLKSLLRIDRHCAVSRAAEKKFHVTIEDPDKFEPEIHIIFDDAFSKDGKTKQNIVNSYVQQFLDCLDEAATELLGVELRGKWDSTPTKAMLPYGGRLAWTLPGKTKMIAHLKDKSKIRHRKRWSQVMYLYYLLGFKTFGYKSRTEVVHGSAKTEPSSFLKTFNQVLPVKEKNELQNTFILTLDGDVDFKPKAVLLLIDRMKKNSKVGAVCGRIHPIGSGPVVWYQKFEYAIGHWLQKAAEHVLGCVLCCPGCFSLFRASALIDDNVMKTYTKKPNKALHYIQFEQGEDRWLCTLLLQQGYKVDYCAGADAYTFAPESFNEFFIQRRRWSPSTNANIFDLLMSWRQTCRQNANISRLFIAYQALMLATSLLAPATVTIMITGSYSAVLDFSEWNSYLLSLAPVVFFITVCIKCQQEVQLFFAALFSAAYTIVMVIVTVGTLLNVTSDQVLSPNVLFLIALLIIFSVSAVWHPKEFGCLVHGLIYYVAVPSTFIFLTIYYICNLNIVSWGTRENKQAQTHATVKKDKNYVSAFLKNVSNKILWKQKNISSPSQIITKSDDFMNQVVMSESDTKSDEIKTQNKNSWMDSDAFRLCEPNNECQKEAAFWRKIINKYLLPIEGNKTHEDNIKADLISLRNNVVFGFFMINFMFSIALLQLQINREKLLKFYFVGKYEPISVIFLSLFSVLLILQFFSMLIHRWGTFQHLISSTRVFSCRKLSDKEKFEIHFHEAKEHIEQSEPVYDDEKDIVTEDRDEEYKFSENNPDLGDECFQNTSSLYEKEFTRNFERTQKLKIKRRSGLVDVDWSLMKLPKHSNLKREYINKLYN